MASRAIFLCHTDVVKVLLQKWMGFWTVIGDIKAESRESTCQYTVETSRNRTTETQERSIGIS